MKNIILFVKGMHCASCEILIEKKLLEIKGVRAVDASVRKGRVVISYEGEKPSLNELNKVFKKDGYSFFDKPKKEEDSQNKKSVLIMGGLALLVIVIFFNLNKFGFESFLNVSAGSSLPAFLFLGVLAGFTSCAALVGGLLLSISKQWNSMYAETDSFFQKSQPHLMFGTGRLLSFGAFGSLLGLFGSKIQLSSNLTLFLIFIVSLIMIILALQMMGIKYFRGFQFVLPKFITRNIANEKKFKGKHMPFVMGALTFFLPCGFTITAQGLALIAGDPIQSSLIMFLFALGTAPSLLLIGLSSAKFFDKPHFAKNFSKFAGILILFFAVYNIDTQLTVAGFPSFSDVWVLKSQNFQELEGEKGFAPIVDGKQLLEMDALSFGYEPNYFKIRSDMPVRWEIADRGTSGCTNAVISRGLFDGEIALTPGKVSVKEFNSPKAGRYRFSCWMGMITGIIDVVDPENMGVVDTKNSFFNEEAIPLGVSDSSVAGCSEIIGGCPTGSGEGVCPGGFGCLRGCGSRN